MKWLLAIVMVLPVLTTAQEVEEIDREPAAVSVPKKRNYPGGADEEDLTVQAQLPEATQRIDARTLQRDVYKGLYNAELKDDRQDAVEE